MTLKIETRTLDQLFEHAYQHGFGDFHVKFDPQTGMQAIIAIHSTFLGPALGGCRFIEYPDTSAALYDALRLARGMSYKAASVHLPLGGGKAVIIKPRTPFDRVGYFKAFGQFVEEQQGRYITALDSGTELSDMDCIGTHTRYVASLSQHGDPSPATAEGVFQGICAAVLFRYGQTSLHNIHVAIQGLGHVGAALAYRLSEAGAQLTLADINPTLTQTIAAATGATIASTDTIHETPCHVFSPCALGAILNHHTIPKIQADIIAGAANNQLANEHQSQALYERGILYAPDYIINAGGLIYAAQQYLNEPHHVYAQRLNQIPTSLLHIFEQSKQTNQPTDILAERIAKERLSC